MSAETISQKEFDQFRQLIFEQAGITLSDAKKRLVVGRLGKRLRHYRLQSFGDYFNRLMSHQLEPQELQVVIDQLTTNETHFFREPAHFDFLREQVLAPLGPGRRIRVWSAASSSGEEAYSSAMVIHDRLGEGTWEVFGSDINRAILQRAQRAVYSMNVAHEIPEHYLKRYCLKGVRSQEGAFLIAPELRKHVRFEQVNLNAPLPNIGEFDVIFLRNVMIYFSLQTKQSVVARMLPKLKPGGYFIVGHSESLNGVTDSLELIRPTLYRKPL
ncbi:protein-glutamate O-methyltransferase CheR [Motiliproteus sp. SC1-56]|uniref:CheR family methyltransferase n=1 Tax=Motiliproteus sp. SC1-56 TaxID=2799565 RepID=UPI001A8D791B|nr:CheR family methyltransferase [Motiliproteus sp. SC1-56]